MIPSQPVALREYIAESWRIFHRIFLRSALLVGLASVPLWPIIDNAYYMDQWQIFPASEQTRVAVLFSVWVVLAFLAQVLITELSVAEYEQRDENLRDAFRRLRKNIPRILRFGLFLTMPILLSLTALTMVVSSIASQTVLLVVMLGIVAGALVIAMRSWFYFPLIISEGLTAFKAFRRIIRLTQGNHWRSLGYLLFSLVFVFVASILVDQIFEIAGMTLPTNFLSNVGIIAGVGLIVPLQAAFQTVFYYDLRTRVEGPLEYPS